MMRLTVLASALALAGCAATPALTSPSAPEAAPPSYYGTLHPFASEAIYFVVTDRFVDGDPGNNYPEDSGFDVPLEWPNGDKANVGYLGGDFKGVLNNADYIRDMGFTSVWITPIVQNPSEAFNGGHEITQGGIGLDKGKAAYHGYWGNNFYQLDKHWPSKNLDFAQFTAAMAEQELGVVLDVVLNHGSPAYTMDPPQAGFGKLYDAEGKLVADHQNRAPQDLDPTGTPLHAFFNTQPDLAQLADFDAESPEVMDYFTGAYLQWIGQGARAFRVDTVKHVPKAAWAEFTARIRAEHPDFFMFGEAYSFEADEIAEFTWQRHGAMSVLDFPMKQTLGQLFEQGGSYAALEPVLHLEDGPYANPYELTTFYDNHDMPRINASDQGFIDAHNWLFTARGIPVIYYGSEVGFERGKAEHSGNRNYFGQDRVDAAEGHPIRANLGQIAQVRKHSVALQRGLQLNLAFEQDTAAFYRVYQHQGEAQTALVLLNKSDAVQSFSVTEHLQSGLWREALTGSSRLVGQGGSLEAQVPAHGVRVFLRDGAIEETVMAAPLAPLAEGRQGDPDLKRGN